MSRKSCRCLERASAIAHPLNISFDPKTIVAFLRPLPLPVSERDVGVGVFPQIEESRLEHEANAALNG